MLDNPELVRQLDVIAGWNNTERKTALAVTSLDAQMILEWRRRALTLRKVDRADTGHADAVET